MQGESHERQRPWTLSVAPRPWQEEAFEIWSKKRRGIVHVVTGAGKTMFAFLCMLSFYHNHKNARFVIIVPTISLLDQWYINLIEDLHVPENEIACFSGEEHGEEPATVNLMVINTARERARKVIVPNSTFLIADECHRAGSPCNASALAGSYSATLGLSATPEREYDSGFDDHLIPSLGPLVFTYDYTRAYNDHVICKFELVNVKVPLISEESQKYQYLTKLAARAMKKLERGEITEENLKILLMRRAAIASCAAYRIPVAAKIVDDNRGVRTLVFHERIQEATKIYDVLLARKHNVAAYHTKIGPAVRRQNLLLFRKGLFDVLISCRALDEGMNVPEASLAVIASSTASVRQRIQRLGRVLRPAKGKNQATIYTLYATRSEEQRLRRECAKMRDITEITWKEVHSHDVPHAKR